MMLSTPNSLALPCRSALLCHALAQVRGDHLGRDRRGDGAAELRGALDRDRDRDLGVVRGCECDEPCGSDSCYSRLGGAGLARDVQVSNIRGLTGALLYDAQHHVAQLV